MDYGEMFKEVHGGRHFHQGARRTWLKFNERFSGHRVRYDQIEDMIMRCPICQKDRLRVMDRIEPVVRHLKPPHARSRVGEDNLTVTPVDANGNGHLVVIVCHFTKYVWAKPAKTWEAETIAKVLFEYFCTFGLYDEIWSDPGSDLMSNVVELLHKWLGVKHVISLVDRHESNGVEGTNKQILRHLKTLVHDERVVKKWSDPTILCLVLFVINDEVNSETGVRPLDARFGSSDGAYLKFPEDAVPGEVSHQWLSELDADLKNIRDKSAKYQEELAAKRLKNTPEEFQNVYKPGEMILWQRSPDQPLPSKLSSHYLGPYEVISQNKNDVVCRHMATGEVKYFHVTRVKMFHGSKEEGRQAAMLDADQYVVRRILAWKGSPTERSYMWFKVEYEDGDILWQEFTQDLFACQAMEDFVNSQRPLFLLRFPANMANARRAELNRTDITEVRPGDKVYVDLRRWGEA